MSLGGGLLLFLLCFFVMLLYLPIRLKITLLHQDVWELSFSIQIWCMKKTITIAERTFLPTFFENKEWDYQQLQINLKPMVSLIYRAISIAAKHLSIEILDINCKSGWQRADYTAYCYGLFWAVISMLPIDWQKNCSVQYMPDFHSSHKYVSIQGIIFCRVGQLIAILTAWFWLIVHTMLEYNRKERISDER